MDRRSYLCALGTVGATTIAGCSGESGGGSSETVVDDRDTVTEDQYLTYRFGINRTADLSIETTVRDGPRLDFVLADQSEAQEFENGNRFRYYEGASDLDSAGYSTTGTVEEGDYAFIVDNSNMLEAKPPTNFEDDNARVEILIEAE
ncbi:hypothetical protein [Haloparvum sedimenti]|uniref:hypothetical protein n=1 Tax=Haloparvum sedimenti TaxID=1678448 RepID=UPI00071E92E1|nr:hypothetical protein [Haloparvum sedimenti]